MAAEELTAMDALSGVGTVLGIATGIQGLFASSPPSASEIADAVTAELKLVFFDYLEAGQINTAAGVLDTVRGFLFSDYVNAVAEASGNNQPTDYQSLWDTLNNSNLAPSQSDLADAYNTLEHWLQTEEGRGSRSKALSTMLGLALHRCLLHRERGTVLASLAAEASDPTIANEKAHLSRGAFDDMRSTAKDALATLTPRVMDTIFARMDVRYEELDTYRSGYTPMFHFSSIIDHGLKASGKPDTLYAYDEDGTGHPLDYVALVAPLWVPYRKVLWDASDDSWQQLTQLILSTALNECDGWSNDKQGFIDQSLDNVLASGEWARDARELLMALDLLATGLPGASEDNWCGCAKCGLLYHGAARGYCIAGGAHIPMLGLGSVAENFVVHRLDRPLHDWGTDEVPNLPNGVGNLARCTKCQALVSRGLPTASCVASGHHVSAAGEMLSGPDGTKYPDTGYRYVCTGEVPPEQYKVSADKPFTPGAQLGLTTVRSGWQLCDKCSCIYNPAIKGMCRQDGKEHVPVGSSQFWLPFLGGNPNSTYLIGRPFFRQPPGDLWGLTH